MPLKSNQEKQLEQPIISKHWLKASLFLLLPFIIFAAGISLDAEWVNKFDQYIAGPFFQIRNTGTTSFFSTVTHLGGEFFIASVVVLSSLFLIWQDNYVATALWFALQTAIGAGLLNQLFKFVFHRTRPAVEHLVAQGGFSFPSGHSMAAMICYGGLAFIFTLFVKNKLYRWFIFVFAGTLIILIGISRIYVGVHFPSDVAAGFSMGAAWLALSISIYPNWMRCLKKIKAKRF